MLLLASGDIVMFCSLAEYVHPGLKHMNKYLISLLGTGGMFKEMFKTALVQVEL